MFDHLDYFCCELIGNRDFFEFRPVQIRFVLPMISLITEATGTILVSLHSSLPADESGANKLTIQA
jgi:hypothetical protein